MAIEIIEISDASEIVATGNSQIAEIEASIKDLERDINTAQLELDDIAQARAIQVDTLDNARVTSLQLEQIYGQAQAYAALTVGTGQERRAIADCATAKQAYNLSRKGLEKLTRHIEDCNKSAELRERELRESKHLCNAEMELRERPSLINNDRKRRLEQTRDAYLTLMQAR